MFSKIIATGSYLPENIVTNRDLEQQVDTTDEWIRARTGIEQRRIASIHQNTSDLAYEAANRAINKAEIAAESIDLIIVGTCTPDVVTPNVGTIIQERLGIKSSAAFSVEAACSGFIYAMNIADKFIRSGDSSCALVVGADTLSRITDWTDRNTCVLFADGAGAAILQPSDTPGILSSELGADGAYGDLLYVPYGTSRKPEQPKPDDYCLHMKGNEVFKVAVKTLESITLEALAKQNMNINDIDWLIPHQANTRIIHSVAKRLSIPIEKVIITLQKHGNTSAASIPLALDEGINSGKISSGDTILMLGFGAGFTWGTMIITL